MSENPEDEFLRKWREAWKTDEGKDRLMHFFLRTPRRPCPEPLLQWRPIIPEPEPTPKHDGFLDEDKQYKVSLTSDASLVSLFDPVTYIHLYPSEALSLLAWLEQHREILEQKTKGQERIIPCAN